MTEVRRSTGTITYLSSEYPAVSHTFILREVLALRKLGVSIETASIRMPINQAALDDAAHAELQRTFYIKKRLLSHGVQSTARCFFKRPYATLKAFCQSLRLGGFKGPAYFLEALVLLDWMRQNKSEHIHVHFANAAASVANIASCTGLCTYSVSVHGPDVFDNVHGISLPRKLQDACFVRSISHYCTAQMRRWIAPGSWSKLHIVRCGVPKASLELAPKRASVPQVLCVGRLCAAKGQHQLLQASKRLHELGLSHHLTLVGAGPDEASLRDKARKLGIEQQVTFTGALGQDRVQRLYSQADLFVLPSYAEGVPVVLMEAMARGLPVVSTRITGIPELVEDKKTGLLVTPADDDELVNALQTLLADHNQRQELGAAARNFVAEKFCIDGQSERLAQLFERYTGRPHA